MKHWVKMLLLGKSLILFIAGSSASFARADVLPIQTELRFGSLSNLKEAVTDRTNGFVDLSQAVFRPTPRQRELIVAAFLTSKHLRSWMLLGDANDENKLLSPVLAEAVKSPACYQRILFEVLDRDLAQGLTSSERESILANVINPEHFDRFKWTHPYSDEHTDFKGHLDGTKSADGRNGQLSPFLSSLYETVQLLGARRERALQEIERVEKAACPTQLNLHQAFSWADLDAAQEIILNRGALSEDQWIKRLDQLIQSTSVPKPTGQNAGGLVAGVSFALRPMVGVITDQAGVPKEFYPRFFKLLEAKAFPHGRMTPQSCTDAARVLSWANFLGLEVSGFPEQRKAQGIEFKHLKLSTQIGLAGATALIRGQRMEWIPCADAMAGTVQFWNAQIDLMNVVTILANSSGGSFQMRGYSGFWDGPNVIGYGVNQGIEFTKGIGRSIGKVFTAAPSAHFALHYPGEWPGEWPEESPKTSGTSPQTESDQPKGFALKIHSPSGLSIARPSNAKFDPKAVEETSPMMRMLRQAKRGL